MFFCSCSANVKAVCSAVTCTSQNGDNWLQRKMKHWETGYGSLPLTLAALTTHSNFPSFSFSKQTVAAASLALHAVVLHTLVHKVHQDVQGTAAWEDLSKLQNGEEAGKHHCMGRRERQSPQSPGGKSVPEQSHSERRVLPKAGHTGQ